MIQILIVCDASVAADLSSCSRKTNRHIKVFQMAKYSKGVYYSRAVAPKLEARGSLQPSVKRASKHFSFLQYVVVKTACHRKSDCGCHTFLLPERQNTAVSHIRTRCWYRAAPGYGNARATLPTRPPSNSLCKCRFSGRRLIGVAGYIWSQTVIFTSEQRVKQSRHICTRWNRERSGESSRN